MKAYLGLSLIMLIISKVNITISAIIIIDKFLCLRQNLTL